MKAKTMLSLGLLALISVSLTAASAIAATKRAPDTVLATEQAVFSASAFGDTVAWSSYDANAKSFHLVVQRAGQTEQLPVPAMNRPFDVELGPGPKGKLAAVYSRCKGHSGQAKRSGRRCTVYLYDFASRKETRYGKLSSTGKDKTLQPAIWHNDIAYKRSRGAVSHVYVADIASRSSAREVPVERWSCSKERTKYRRSCSRHYYFAVLDIGIESGHVALATETYIPECSHFVQSDIFVNTGSGSARSIASVCPGEDGQQYIGSTFEGHKLYFLYSQGVVYAYDPATHKYAANTAQGAIPGAVFDYSQDADFTRGGGVDYVVAPSAKSPDAVLLLRLGRGGQFKRVPAKQVLHGLG